jgi:hypothetical protein
MLSVIGSDRIEAMASAQRRSTLGHNKKRGLVAVLKAALDPEVAAKRADLRYVHDLMPGITRHKTRDGFRLPAARRFVGARHRDPEAHSSPRDAAGLER